MTNPKKEPYYMQITAYSKLVAAATYKEYGPGGYYGDDDIPTDEPEYESDDDDPRDEYNPDDKEDDNENNREW